MNQDFSKLFSTDNPFFQQSLRMHKLAADTFDLVARSQVELMQDLVNINRARFEALHASASVSDAMNVQHQATREVGEKVIAHGEEVINIIGDAQNAVVDVASDWTEQAQESAKKATTKAKKAA